RLNLSNALLDPSQLPPGQYNVSVASVYTDYGRPVACGGVLQVPELGVANKTLPCGTMVIFRYGGRAIKVPVIDRGPYIAGRDWDLTGAAAEALHFSGFVYIEWRLGYPAPDLRSPRRRIQQGQLSPRSTRSTPRPGRFAPDRRSGPRCSDPSGRRRGASRR